MMEQHPSETYPGALVYPGARPTGYAVTGSNVDYANAMLTLRANPAYAAGYSEGYAAGHAAALESARQFRASRNAPPPPRGSYVLHSSDATEAECFEIGVLGAPNFTRIAEALAGITAGTPLILYNVTTKSACGPLVATGPAEVGLVPGAFASAFELHVPFEKLASPLDRPPEIWYGDRGPSVGKWERWDKNRPRSWDNKKKGRTGRERRGPSGGEEDKPAAVNSDGARTPENTEAAAATVTPPDTPGGAAGGAAEPRSESS